MNQTIILVLLIVILSACRSRDTGSTLLADAIQNEASEDAGLCMWKEIAVRETPAEKGKYLTSIYLGEKLTVFDDTVSENVNGKKTVYRHIELIDGTKGWVRVDLIATSAVAASFSKESTVYKRPDLMTATAKAFQPMDFVAVKTVLENGWTEVIGKRVGDNWFTSGWIRNENLVKADNDVAFAVFYNRAMENKDPAKQYTELQTLLANEELSSSVFFETLSQKVYAEKIEAGMLHADESGETLDSAASNQ